MTIEMELVGVRVQLPSNTPILLLRETHGRRRTVPIYIGGPEAHAIDLALQGKPIDRPMTHDLFVTCLESMGVALERVVVTELQGGTFFAELYLRDPSSEVRTVSARPSDAVALAVRTGTPIFAEESLIDEAGVEDDDDDDTEGDEELMVEQLRQFLDQVNPEDFLPD
jgi:bifunctional DNase/RNase